LISEAYTSDQEFLVDRILSEKLGSEYTDGKKRFLILWADYPLEKATWEPKENIQDPIILSAWKERKEDEEKGLKTRFNIAEFEAQLNAASRAKEDRHRRRKAKRKALGMPVSPDHETFRRADDSDSTEAEEYDEVSDAPGMKRKFTTPRKGQSSTLSSSRIPYANDQEQPAKRRASIQKNGGDDRGESDESDDSHGTGTSEDSLILDLKAAERKKKSKKKAPQAPRDKRLAQASASSPTAREKPMLKRVLSVCLSSLHTAFV
jgi:chromo domain-containing protein 1